MKPIIKDSQRFENQEMQKLFIFPVVAVLFFVVLFAVVDGAHGQTQSNTCEDGMLYDSNTNSCIKDTYKNIRDSIIPNWIKQTAVWWGQGMVTDDEFLDTLQYLVNEKLLEIPSDNLIDSSSMVSENPFELKVISCSNFGTDSVKTEYSVTSNFDQAVDIELVIKGVDINRNVLSISTPTIYDLIPGQTKYDHTYIDNYPDLDSCEIGINDIR